jgi:hypothetical protein
VIYPFCFLPGSLSCWDRRVVLGISRVRWVTISVHADRKKVGKGEKTAKRVYQFFSPMNRVFMSLVARSMLCYAVSLVVISLVE